MKTTEVTSTIDNHPAGSESASFGDRRREAGAVGWGLLWLLGIPIPILIVLFVLRGCT